MPFNAQLLSESRCLFDLNLLLNAGLRVCVCLCMFLRRVGGQKSASGVIWKNKSDYNMRRNKEHEGETYPTVELFRTALLKLFHITPKLTLDYRPLFDKTLSKFCVGQNFYCRK